MAERSSLLLFTMRMWIHYQGGDGSLRGSEVCFTSSQHGEAGEEFLTCKGRIVDEATILGRKMGIFCWLGTAEIWNTISYMLLTALRESMFYFLAG